PARPAGTRPWTAPAESPALIGDELARFEASSAGTLPFERFEFSRRDAALNVVDRVPIASGRQWPEAPRPRERRVRFHFWRQ
ncbi:MAG TPA: hypothetical protein DEB06_07510, partial [Phycisphaerales bacterium]|nr:hypothetical protein [Phycisphaerales bacterium]